MKETPHVRESYSQISAEFSLIFIQRGILCLFCNIESQMRCIFVSKNRKQDAVYSVSQNFLTSRRTIERLIRLAGIQKQDTVLEIGAGKGHITKALSEACEKVISYEIDPHLYEKLKGQLDRNVRLYRGDFLTSRLPNEDYLVFANIPFFITTDIVRKLINADPLPRGMWLIMEKGAAKRFCGLPKDSLMSLQIKPRYDMKIVHYFSSEDFHPAPGVDVVMLEFRRKPDSDVPPGQWASYQKFLRHSLQYGLFGKNALLTKKQIDTALKLEGLPRLTPSGEILYIQWLCLFRCWLRFGRPV